MILFLLLIQSASAWDHHWIVTKGALISQENLRKESLRVTRFEDCIQLLGYASAAQFNQTHLLHPAYRFAFQAGEAPGQAISPIKVLSIYADEPDHGMDVEVFDHYPELWKDKYKMMGGRKGTPSQAFRHMYWEKWNFRAPIQSFRLPPFEPMGEAGERAARFIDLSRKAKRVGHHYWAARFLANALHYLEDVANPFHSTQTPTKRFLLMPIVQPEGTGLRNFVRQTTQIVVYYHFAFERYIGSLMMDYEKGKRTPENEGFARSLATNTALRNWHYDPQNPAQAIVQMALISNDFGGEAGSAGVDFFPQIQVPYADLDPDRYMDPDWWNETFQRGARNSPAKQKYFRVVNEMFSTLGQAIRTIVAAEL